MTCYTALSRRSASGVEKRKARVTLVCYSVTDFDCACGRGADRNAGAGGVAQQTPSRRPSATVSPPSRKRSATRREPSILTPCWRNSIRRPRRKANPSGRPESIHADAARPFRFLQRVLPEPKIQPLSRNGAPVLLSACHSPPIFRVKFRSQAKKNQNSAL